MFWFSTFDALGVRFKEKILPRILLRWQISNISLWCSAHFRAYFIMTGCHLFFCLSAGHVYCSSIFRWPYPVFSRECCTPFLKIQQLYSCIELQCVQYVDILGTSVHKTVSFSLLSTLISDFILILSLCNPLSFFKHSTADITWLLMSGN